jgi:tetratricopeptide (TPR) repeat protein
MLDAQLFGLEPAAFHTTSALLHVLASLLLLVGLRRLTGQLAPSAFAAAVFALHPLHVESVAWVSARKDVLSGVFFALALLCHERRVRGPRAGRWAAALFVSMALGLMAKPSLVTLPFVLLLLDAWPLGRLRRASDGGIDPGAIAKVVAEKLPLFALSGLFSAITLMAQRAGGALQSGDHYPLAIRLANAVDAYAAYLEQAFWPVGLAVFYPYPLGGPPVGGVVVSALALVLVSVWALRSWRDRPYRAVGWLWFLGMLVPMIGLVQVGQASRADRYTYLPLIGLAIVVGWELRRLGQGRPALARGLRAAGVLGLALLAVLSFRQVLVWRDSGSLFRHALAVTSGNHVAHINLGMALASSRRFEQAESHLDRAVALQPASARARGLRGEVRVALGRHEDAAADFQTARRSEPGEARWEVGWGRVLADQGRDAAAESAFRRALELQPERADVHALLGLVLLRSGRTGEAIASYRRALADEAALRRGLGEKGVAQVRAQYGGALAQAGHTEEALVQLDAALAGGLDDAAEVLARRGSLLESLGREAEAAEAYRAALGSGDRSVRLLNNLAWLLASASDPGVRDPDEALALAQEAAVRTRRNDPRVLDTLSVAEAAAGRPEQARATARRALALAEARGLDDLARSLRERGVSRGPAQRRAAPLR